MLVESGEKEKLCLQPPPVMALDRDPLADNPESSNCNNPHVFMDISIGGNIAGRLTIEVFANIVPRTAENFRALCTGERGIGRCTKRPLHFRGTKFYRIVRGAVAQGGDISDKDGYGVESIYGGKFRDENFLLKHNERGILSMANSGPYGNGSLFFVTFKAMPHLDGKNVVFGKVVHGMDVLKRLEDAGTGNGRPSCRVEIAECGELSQSFEDKDSNSRMSRGLSFSSDCNKKRKRSGSLISQPPTPTVEDHVEEPSLREIIDTMLVESGEKEKLCLQPPPVMALDRDPLADNPESSNCNNPHVFMDISIGGNIAGRLTIEVFANIVPRTAENFRALCTGERGIGRCTKRPLHFRGTKFYRIVRGAVAQGGDISDKDGYGVESIYGGKFRDENFLLKHNERGILSMANSGPYGNGSLFFVTFKAMPHLDGKNVVFGKVVHGMDVLKRLEDAGTGNGRPSCRVEIAECGELSQSFEDKDSNSRMSRGLSFSSDCNKKRKRSGSLISQPPTPTVEDHVEEPSLREIIDTMLVESGEKEKLCLQPPPVMALDRDPLADNPESSNCNNPHVFMDISIGGNIAGRLTIEVFANIVPRTAENFRALCTGERGIGRCTKRPLHFRGTKFYRIVRGAVAQGGDISDKDGYGGESIYGGKFRDSNSRMSRGLSFSSDCNKKRKRSGSLISQPPTPAAEEHVEEPSLREIIDTMLVESGEKEKLMGLLRKRLEECGWREEMEECGRDYARKKGKNNVTRDDIIYDITKKGRASVPNYVKEELLKHIQTFLESSLLC